MRCVLAPIAIVGNRRYPYFLGPTQQDIRGWVGITGDLLTTDGGGSAGGAATSLLGAAAGRLHPLRVHRLAPYGRHRAGARTPHRSLGPLQPADEAVRQRCHS